MQEVWNKGKKCPEISRSMMGNKNALGHKHSVEARRKMSEAHEGMVLSKETRERMSKAKRGTILSEEHKRKISKAMTGRKVSIETRKRVSEGHKGAKSYLWQGGITAINAQIRNSIEYRLWREAVFARDNWICQKCKNGGGKLCAHHIRNFARYPKLRFVVDNGITLCRQCHKKFHKKYGKKNNTKEQLSVFLRTKQL